LSKNIIEFYTVIKPSVTDPVHTRWILGAPGVIPLEVDGRVKAAIPIAPVKPGG
jgi:hypothetical protein